MATDSLPLAAIVMLDFRARRHATHNMQVVAWYSYHAATMSMCLTYATADEGLLTPAIVVLRISSLAVCFEHRISMY